MAPHIELFAFRYRDPLTGKWTRARYAATREVIAGRCAEYETARPADVRDVDPGARYFTPHRAAVGNLGKVLALASASRRLEVAGVAR